MQAPSAAESRRRMRRKRKDLKRRHRRKFGATLTKIRNVGQRVLRRRSKQSRPQESASHVLRNSCYFCLFIALVMGVIGGFCMHQLYMSTLLKSIESIQRPHMVALLKSIKTAPSFLVMISVGLIAFVASVSRENQSLIYKTTGDRALSPPSKTGEKKKAIRSFMKTAAPILSTDLAKQTTVATIPVVQAAAGTPTTVDAVAMVSEHKISCTESDEKTSQRSDTQVQNAHLLARIEKLEETLAQVRKQMTQGHTTGRSLNAAGGGGGGGGGGPKNITKTSDSKDSNLPAKYRRMLKMHIPRQAVMQKMVLDGLDPKSFENGGGGGTKPAASAGITASMLQGKRLKFKKHTRKAKRKPEEQVDDSVFKVTPDMLSLARSNLRKRKKKKRTNHKRKRESGSNAAGGLEISVDILKSMRKSLKSARKKIVRRKLSVNGGITVGLLQSVTLNKTTPRRRKSAAEMSGTAALRKHMIGIKLKKTGLSRSPGGTPLSKVRSSLLGRLKARTPRQSPLKPLTPKTQTQTQTQTQGSTTIPMTAGKTAKNHCSALTPSAQRTRTPLSVLKANSVSGSSMPYRSPVTLMR